MFIFIIFSEKRQKYDNGEDPLDPESGQHHGFNPFQQFHQFHHGSPFQFKFHFNWQPWREYTVTSFLSVPLSEVSHIMCSQQFCMNSELLQVLIYYILLLKKLLELLFILFSLHCFEHMI